MAVAYVSDVEDKNETGTATELPLNNVLGGGGGANGLVIAIFTWRRNAAQDMTGATFGGNAMTQIGSPVLAGGGALAAWRYVGSLGTQNVIGTWGTAPQSMQGTAAVFSGVDQTTPIGTTASGTGTGVATATGAVTSAADGLCFDGLFIRGSPTGITVDAAQTERSAQTTSASVHHRTSTEPGAASVTMAWTWTGANDFGHLVIPIAAAAAGGGVPRFMNIYRRLRSR